MTIKQRHDFGKRPKCIQCGGDRQFLGTYTKAGLPQYRKYCQKCHHKRQGAKKGLTANEWLNSFHDYKKYRKVYCENGKSELAGWLGFVCTTRIVAPHLQLDIDHLDGNSDNNEEDNLMTLCKCCHSIKTNMFMDYATPGRKARKQK